MIKKSAFLISLTISILTSRSIPAKDFHANGPLISRTQNPIYLMTLGQIPTTATSLDKGVFSNWVGFDYSNIFDLGVRDQNEVFLDMELARLSYNVDWGLGRGMEFGLQIPFLHFNGGYFDSWIQDFHKAFGFPNAGRNRYPNGMFRYRVTENGRVIYNVRRMAIGLSDIILGFKYNFLEETNVMPAFAWTFRYKLPTGKFSSGLGNGGIDYSIGLVAEKSISRWHFYANLDYIISSGDTAFDHLENGQMFAWLTAVEFNVSKPVSIVAQLQGSTPLLSGMGTNKWDGFPMDLLLGVKGYHERLFWGNDFFWQWGFSEDIASEGPAVDITTMLVLGVRFGRIDIDY